VQLAFPDNSHALALVDCSEKGRPNGIMQLLDDQWRLGERGSAKSFLQAAVALHGGGGRSAEEGAAAEAPPEALLFRHSGNNDSSSAAAPVREGFFCVAHYAGPVVYEAEAFVRKNRLELRPNLRDAVGLVPWHGCAVQEGGAGGAGAGEAGASHLMAELCGRHGDGVLGPADEQKASVCSRFRKQLKSLVAALAAAAPLFVRCLKPHDQPAMAARGAFDRVRVLEQLRCAGVMAVLQVCTNGYPHRLSHVAFFRRFHMLAPKRWSIADRTSEPSAVARALLQRLQRGRPSLAFAVGHSAVLYRYESHCLLEELRQKELDKAAFVCQVRVTVRAPLRCTRTNKPSCARCV
jgi:myosin heavy subunit